ncbi:MAG: MBL fold metallo-hydrolase [bacterium]
MIVEKIEVGVFAENCYMVGCEETREAVVIDPGDEIAKILDRIEDRALNIKYILLTHAHLDHVKEVQTFKRSLPVPILMHAADQFLLDNLPAQAAAFGLTTSGIPHVDVNIDEGDEIAFGQLRFKVLHTPGHSPGSVSFVASNAAFVGDALFAGSIGRTDLPGGDYDLLMKSIREKLLTLPEATEIYPGHGPVSTIGHEKQTNPFLTTALR